MKTIFALSLLALSLSSFAGAVRMVSTQECASTVDKSISEDSQKSELTKCAERRAHSELSRKCEARGTGLLLESEIAQRNFKSYSDENGRTMTVSAMAVGRCEF